MLPPQGSRGHQVNWKNVGIGQLPAEVSKLLPLPSGLLEKRKRGFSGTAQKVIWPGLKESQGKVLGMNQALWLVLILEGKGAVGAAGDSVPLIIPVNRGFHIFSFSF